MALGERYALDREQARSYKGLYKSCRSELARDKVSAHA
ncbi:hypothetical protein C4K05_0505 [Pseudomonas chlororaphis subsp. aureofaciens]|nr:hypothetical protein C4K11_0486 [Pseudomonas chlororaphis subsp. aureofaciens]AZE14960.1 hypothetical protein C4K09_0470 [Pseudomonas chlororaphis subsp. aureofaciens]AZE39874.1 hypothetical protein C4K05_0505 [Pseudomonas chlororaphis subsp. aureofaciens]